MFRCLYYHAKKKTPPPINSDNQDLSALKNKAIVENGVMKFRDKEHFNEFLNLSFDELVSLEKTYGYISYDTKIDQVLDELDLVATKSEFKSFKKKYQNYMTTRIRENEESYECIVPPNSYSLIANENGLYYIGDTACRVVGEYLISSSVKNVSKLLKLEYDDLVNQSNSLDFKTKKYIKIHDLNNSLKSTKSYLGGDLNASATNPANDRRVFLRAYAFTDQVAGGHRYIVNLYAWGQKKSWLVGWRDYKTSIYMYGADPGTDVDWYTTYWGNSSWYMFNYQASNTKTLIVQLFNQIVMMSGDGDPIYFTKVKLKAHTGGTTPATYAEINAQ